MGKKFLSLLFGLVLCLYPFCVYFGLQHFGPRLLGLVLFGLFALRYFTLKDTAGFFKLNLLPAASALGAAFCLLTVAADRSDFLKFYPVLSNIFFLTLFVSSLRHPPTVIERLARLRHPNLTPRGVRHTRQVTVVWCLFFVLNGCAAFYTAAYMPLKTWTFYNGFLSYALMALLLLLELPVRLARMAQDKREEQAA